jgi:hypothetical protein
VRSFSKTIVKYPKTSIAVFLFGICLLLLGLFWFQPFSPKYQGKTVDDWLTYYARASIRMPVSEEVVLAFGTSALPALEKAAERPSRVAKRLGKHTQVFLFLNKTFSLYARVGPANDWARSLYLDRKELFLSSVKSPALLRAALRGAPQRELEEYVNQSTNLILKTNADLVLELGEMLHQYHRYHPNYAR